MSVTYVNDGDLATPANVNEWLNRAGGEIFNVKSYGAIGDGATDDTTAIQAAIDAVSAAGGTVWFPEGTYVITSTLTIGISKTRLAGPGVISVTTANTTAITFDAGITQITCEVFKIEGTCTSASTNKYGIQLPSNSIVKGTWFGSFHAGIQILGTDCRVIGAKVTDSPGSSPGQGYGILCVGARATVTGCSITGVGRHALYFSSDATWGGSSGSVASGNTLEINAPSEGGCSVIKVKSISGQNDTVGVTLTGNSCKVTGTPAASSAIGIEFSGDCKKCVASGNYVEGTNSAALKFVGTQEGGGDVFPEDCVFIGNTVNSTSGFLERVEATSTSKPTRCHFIGTVSDITDFAFPASAINVVTSGTDCTTRLQNYRLSYQLSSGDNTPDAQLGPILRTNNGSATTIVDFENGFTGQELSLFVEDVNTWIDSNSSIIARSGSAISTGGRGMWTFRRNSTGSWFEV